MMRARLTRQRYAPPSRWRSGFGRRRWAAAVAMAWIMTVPAAAQVTVEGELDREEYQYHWTVTNNSPRPITSLRIPHYHGIVFAPPDGWEFEITNKTEVGMVDEPGVVSTRATSPRAAIRPGRTATFKLSFSPDRTAPGTGVVTIGFVDGTTESIPDVTIPWRIPWLRRYTLLISLGAIFVVFLLIQAVRGRRGNGPDSDQSSATSGE